MLNELHHASGHDPASAPFVTATGVYFRGTDNKLWVLNVNGKQSNQINLGNNTTSSTPFVIGQYVFFQGTDNRLLRIYIDGSGGINLGGNFQTSSSPFATSQYVFFRGTDDKLWRMNIDGTNAINIGGYKCSSTPCAAGQFLFFQGTDNTLWRTNLDGSGGFTMAGAKSKSAPTVDTSQNYVYVQGTDDTLWRMNLDGGNSVRVGGYKSSSTPFIVQPSNQPTSGSGLIPYIVLLLAYAPPGTNGGKSNSSVQYSTQSVVGSTVSYAHSSMVQWGVTATVGTPKGGGSSSGSTQSGSDSGLTQTGGSGGDSWGATVGYTGSNSSGGTSTLDIRNTDTTILTIPGPGADGINHDFDLIYILLNPTMNVIVDPRYNMNWGLDFTGTEGSVVFLQMNWLKDPALFASESPSVLARCKSAGMTSADFAQLLALNPFANGQTSIDGRRYALTDIQVTYEASGQGGGQPIMSKPVMYTATYTGVTTSSGSWGLNVSLTGTLGKALALTGAASGSFSMTNTTTTTATNGQTQTVTPTIGGPATGYKGPTRLQIYQDTLYGTLMFYLVDDPVTFSGILRDSNGKAVPNAPVKLTIGLQVLYTWTDSAGNYRFYDTPKGATGNVVEVIEGTKTITKGVISGITTKF